MDRRHFLSVLAAGAVLPRSLLRSFDPMVVGGPAGARRAAGGATGEVYALVLGSVQDGGLPQVGCYTSRCDEGRALHAAGRGRFVTSLAVIEPEAERFYLVDATPDITRQIDLVAEPAFRRRAAERRPFDGIFLTHAHVGHYAGLAVLGNEGLGIRDTPVYCTQAMAAFLASNQPWRFLVDQGRLQLHPLGLDRWHRVDDHLEVQLWKVPHRDEFSDTVAFVFRGPEASVLYLPDINSWARWDRDVAATVAGVDVAVLDGSFWSMDELPGRAVEDVPHPLMTQTMDVLQDVVDRGASRVVLTHLNNSNPALDEGGPEQAEVARRGFEIAREGMRFPL
jgi:pyrroloquinoline quinone biosynthesis protein B